MNAKLTVRFVATAAIVAAITLGAHPATLTAPVSAAAATTTFSDPNSNPWE